jgi:hypothetical protein
MMIRGKEVLHYFIVFIYLNFVTEIGGIEQISRFQQLLDICVN